jgi:trk system potassium uptake protein TrkA
MRVVIVGVGDVGRELAEYLTRRGGNQLVLVDSDESRCEHLAGEIDALVLHGDGANPEILRKAQLQEADALVATTGSDATNTVIAMLGHNQHVTTIIVKLNDAWLRAACRELGVTKIVTPKISAAAQILAALYGFDRMDFSLGAPSGMQMVEVSVKEGYEKRLSDLGMPEDALVVGVLRGRQVLFPDQHARVEKEDVLITLVKNEGAATKVKKLMGQP